MKTFPVSPLKLVLEDFRPGDVLLCRDRSLLSRLIRIVGESRWSHTALGDRVHGRCIIYESTFPRGRMMPLEDWLKERSGQVYVARWRQRQTGSQADASCRWALDAHYRPYDWLALLKYLCWRATGRWPGKKDTAHQLVCCEMVGRAGQFGGEDIHQAGPMLDLDDIADAVEIYRRAK